MHAVDMRSLKKLTLLHDALWLDTQWLDDISKLPADDLAGGSADSVFDGRRSLDELMTAVREEAPKRFREISKIWRPLPLSLNTTMRAAWTRMEYGAEAPDPFATNIDYATEGALRFALAQDGQQLFSREAWYLALHGTWVWAETGVGCATRDPMVFRGLHHLAVAAPDLPADKPGLDTAIARGRQVTAYQDQAAADPLDPVEVAEVMVPDVELLSWDEILYLRSLPSFRHGQELMREGQLKGDVRAVSRWADRQLSDLVLKLRPSMSKSLLNAFVGNLPIPLPVNPIGIAQSVADITSTARINHDFGGVFWLARARDLADAAADAAAAAAAIKRMQAGAAGNS
jgi:hypothetical protein